MGSPRVRMARGLLNEIGWFSGRKSADGDRRARFLAFPAFRVAGMWGRGATGPR